ncbi:hypothetical protein C2G38_2184483 [Gigaspora rosea]|uniref:FAR1 domain-containing protein n=1 Tax=Gigaspora rosea TaxID=44941 RepID=A0A397V9Z4_9GLOM|nr:hypothetical protein C2G38_2184483 [Gigaspora rosea]
MYEPDYENISSYLSNSEIYSTLTTVNELDKNFGDNRHNHASTSLPPPESYSMLTTMNKLELKNFCTDRASTSLEDFCTDHKNCASTSLQLQPSTDENNDDYCTDQYIHASTSSTLSQYVVPAYDMNSFNDELDESDESDDSSDSLELFYGRTFNNWDGFRIWIDRFALEKGFNYKIRTSEIVQVSVETQYHLSKTSGFVKINSFVNEHNHPLTTMIGQIAPRFRKLTSEMLVDIEKYVIQGRMDSKSIFLLLKHDYQDQPIYKRDLYNAVYWFCQKNNSGDTDASAMIQQLLEWKDLEPLWIVKLQLEPVS